MHTAAGALSCLRSSLLAPRKSSREDRRTDRLRTGATVLSARCSNWSNGSKTEAAQNLAALVKRRLLCNSRRCRRCDARDAAPLW